MNVGLINNIWIVSQILNSKSSNSSTSVIFEFCIWVFRINNFRFAFKIRTKWDFEIVAHAHRIHKMFVYNEMIVWFRIQTHNHNHGIQKVLWDGKDENEHRAIKKIKEERRMKTPKRDREPKKRKKKRNERRPNLVSRVYRRETHKHKWIDEEHWRR